ncbi:hypothetical protein QBC47DRAFT_391764 [Echria macrotheca]|uniref:DUF8212 domain-containing protein n=1 Tax=Echria macrotheca TaxID=438768 RepID=A0AAJ0F1N4_9PEZI|nr:hypothetical protein QBC47DRAFT_391764 [Echria macrotheca]
MFRWYQESTVCYAFLSDLKSIAKKRAKGEVWKDVEEKQRTEGGDDRSAEESDGWRWAEKTAKAISEREGERNREQGDLLKPPNKNTGRRHSKERRGSDAKSDASSIASAQSDSGLTFERRVERYGQCRWFTRGWTLQELIAPRRLGFYNQDWGFEGEKEALGDVLAEITGISKRVLGNVSLLSTISVAQRMSWAAKRQTTRAEDMAYCLLGIFGVQIPMLYGEGNRAFIRLQEEIIKESNDLSLFAWTTKVTSQKHWGILALSPKDFASCSDIELWDDPMYNDEFAVTSKGVRVTATAGRSLRWGRDATYVLNLRCFRQGSDQDLGISLRKHGCDIYARVMPDRLCEIGNSGGEISEMKGRVFYMSKIVSPVLSVVLGSSHRNAIDLTSARNTLVRECLHLQKESIEPPGHWDPQRSLFLTQGVKEFVCSLTFTLSEMDSIAPVHLGFTLRGGKLSANFLRDSGPQRFKAGPVLQIRDKRGDLVDWLKLVVQEGVEKGQPLYLVFVDVLKPWKEILGTFQRSSWKGR